MNKKTMFISIILMIILILTNVSYASFIPYTATVYEKQIIEDDYFIFYRGALTPSSMVMIEKDGVEYPAYALYNLLPGVRSYGPYDVRIEGEVGTWDIWRIAINGYPYKTLEQLGCANSAEAYAATQEAIYYIMGNKDNFDDYYSDYENGKRIINAMKQIVNDAKTSTQTPTQINNEIKIQEIDYNWKLDNINNKYISKTYKLNSVNQYEKYTINIDESMKDIYEVVDMNNNPTNTFSYGEQFKILVKIKDIQDTMNLKMEATAVVDNNKVMYGYSTQEGNTNYIISGFKDELKCTLEESISKTFFSTEILSIITSHQTQIEEKIEIEETVTLEKCAQLQQGLYLNVGPVKKLPVTGM